MERYILPCVRATQADVTPVTHEWINHVTSSSRKNGTQVHSWLTVYILLRHPTSGDLSPRPPPPGVAWEAHDLLLRGAHELAREARPAVVARVARLVVTPALAGDQAGLLFPRAHDAPAASDALRRLVLSVARHCTALHCTTQHCIVLPCTWCSTAGS
jgi:hypothetical protein